MSPSIFNTTKDTPPLLQPSPRKIPHFLATQTLEGCTLLLVTKPLESYYHFLVQQDSRKLLPLPRSTTWNNWDKDQEQIPLDR